MSNYEFWIELGNIYQAINAYQEKTVEFNKRFITPWLRLGNIFDKQNRSEDAIKAYEKAVELDPENANVWNEIGNTHFNSGAYDQAVSAYGKAIELDPAFGMPYSNLALTYAGQDRYAEAIPLYKKSIELLVSDEEKAVTWNRLGNAYRRMGDNENAIAAYQMADQLDPDKGVSVGDQSFLSDPLSGIDGIVEDETGVQNGNAAPDVSANPLDPIVPVEAVVPEEQPRPVATAEAEDDPGEQLVVGQPASVEMADAVQTAVDQPKPDPINNEAVPEMPEQDAALATVTNQPDALPDVKTATASDATPPAESTLESVTTVDEPAPVVDDAKAVVEAIDVNEAPTVVPEEADSASEEQTVVAEAVPEETTTEVAPAADLPSLAISEEEIVAQPASVVPDDTKDAAPAQQTAGMLGIEIDSKSAHVWNELGNIYISIGAYVQAIDAYQKAIELDPGFGWPYSNLALTYSHQGQYAEAIPLYMKSIELLGGDKEKAISWNRLGNAYRNANHVENARTAYQTAVDLDPNYADSKDNLSRIHTESVPAPASIEKEAAEPVADQPAVEAPIEMVPEAVATEKDVVEPVADQPAVEAAIEIVPEAVATEKDVVEPAADQPAVEVAIEIVPEAVATEKDVVEPVADQPAVEVAIEIVPEAVATEQDVVEPAADQPAVEAAIEIVLEAVATEQEVVEPVTGQPTPEQKSEPVLDVKPESDSELHPAAPEAAPGLDQSIFEDIHGKERFAHEPENAHIWNELGRTYFNKGNYEQAAYAYAKAIELDPAFGQPYSNLGSTYLYQGKYEEAIPLYQRSVELLDGDRDKAISWNKLGNAYRRLGDYDKAIAAYQMADELDPNITSLPTRSWFRSVNHNMAKHESFATG